MSIDLNFWKYRNEMYCDNASVYQRACCDHERVDGLEDLPIEDILTDTAAAFHDWNMSDPFHFGKKDGQGSFQITTTPQMVRFDCYSMERADMKRFSSLMAKYECPLYDPQQGVRFDKIAVFLIDEAGLYREQAEQELSRLLPRLELMTQVTDWDEHVKLSKTVSHIMYSATIHRAKSQTKVTSFLQFGSAWANRPCQCKTALLENEEEARQLLEELLVKSIGRVVSDFLDRTYYDPEGIL